MKTIPVVYIHYGTIPDYFVRSVNSASAFKNNIIILSETEFNFKDPSISFFPIKKYAKGLDGFDSVYRHMCTNSEEFEKRCIQRWFILRNFMEENNIGVCYYSDSDVMIYDNVSRVYLQYAGYDAAFVETESQENYRWAASACCSYWKMETLGKFCDFILQIYSSGEKTPLDEKWEYHTKNNIPGGICDMTLLYLFSKNINFYPLSKVQDNLAFDGNILVPDNYFNDEYEMIVTTDGRTIKKISWKDGMPYGSNKVLNKEIRFVALTEYAKLINNKATLWDRIGKKIKTMSK